MLVLQRAGPPLRSATSPPLRDVRLRGEDVLVQPCALLLCVGARPLNEQVPLDAFSPLRQDELVQLGFVVPPPLLRALVVPPQDGALLLGELPLVELRAASSGLLALCRLLVISN